MAIKKTSRSSENEEQSDVVVLDDVPPAAEVIDLLAPANGYMYFTERDLNKILFNLDTLRTSVYPRLANQQDSDNYKQPQFPSVCRIFLTTA